MLKERVGAAINSGNLQADEHHRDHEMLAAFALGASWLGNRLWRMKYGEDVQHADLRKVVFRLASMLNNRGKPSVMATIAAEEALREWLEDRCLTCSGKGFTGSEYGTEPKPVERKCGECSGVGKVSIPHRGEFPEGHKKAGQPIMRKVSCARCFGRGSVFERSMAPKAKTQQCGACNGTGALRRSANARLRALNAKIEDHNRSLSKSGWSPTKPMPLMGTDTQERAQEVRDWMNRMDRLIGIMRTADSYQADNVRKKLG